MTIVRMPALATVEVAVDAIRRGRMIVLVDSPDRENEGDLMMAAERVTAADVNFMATHGRGLICVPMLVDRLSELQIPPMVARNQAPHDTAFHVSVDHARHASTGISASDRAHAIRALASPGSVAADFTRPGHVFPLAYRPGGVLSRAGHTEASVDLATLARCAPAAVICEIAGEDGEMARLPSLLEFAEHHDLPLLAITDLIAHRRESERTVVREVEARLPLSEGAFRVVGYRDAVDGREHLAAVLGDVADVADVLVRIHSECVAGDVFGSRLCDCGRRLELALQMIAVEGRGVVVYLRGQPDRGLGVLEGLEPRHARHAADARAHEAGAKILADLRIHHPRLLTDDDETPRAHLRQRRAA